MSFFLVPNFFWLYSEEKMLRNKILKKVTRNRIFSCTRSCLTKGKTLRQDDVNCEIISRRNNVCLWLRSLFRSGEFELFDRTYPGNFWVRETNKINIMSILSRDFHSNSCYFMSCCVLVQWRFNSFPFDGIFCWDTFHF